MAMTTKEGFAIIREAKLSAYNISKITGWALQTVFDYADYLGVRLPRRRVSKGGRTVCEGKPECCFYCPYDDCIDASSCVREETSFVDNALGTRKRDARDNGSKRRKTK